MITPDGWFDWMEREPGPAEKVYSDPCTSEIVVLHDAVGYLPGWYSRLFDMSKLPNGQFTPNAAASVTGWLPYKAGVTPIQHYSIKKSCWASGSRYLNIRGNAFENESAPIHSPDGVWRWRETGEPVNWHNPPKQSAWQVECSIRILQDLSEHFNRPLSYWRRPVSATDVTATEYEHNETVRWGGLYSSCPNKRVRWADINDVLKGDDEVELFKEGNRVYVVGAENGQKVKSWIWPRRTADRLGLNLGSIPQATSEQKALPELGPIIAQA